MSVCFIDLDNLKVVNDWLGHSAGDRLLEAVGADLLRQPAKLAARFGGDEFVVDAIGAARLTSNDHTAASGKRCGEPRQLHRSRGIDDDSGKTGGSVFSADEKCGALAAIDAADLLRALSTDREQDAVVGSDRRIDALHDHVVVTSDEDGDNVSALPTNNISDDDDALGVRAHTGNNGASDAEGAEPARDACEGQKRASMAMLSVRPAPGYKTGSANGGALSSIACSRASKAFLNTAVTITTSATVAVP